MPKVCSYRIFYLFVLFSAFALIVSPRVFADDIQAVLDSADGSSNFSVQDSASSEVMHVDSSGNLVTEGCARIDAGGAECSDTEGLIVDGSVGIGVDSASSALHVDSNAADTTAIMTVQNTAGDFQVFTSNGTPEGTVFGSPGDLCVDWQNGDIYVKNSGTGTTAGWESLLSSSASADFGLSQGSVVFGDTDGSLQEDNANFFWNDTLHRLGIGTISPESLLEIQGGNDTDAVLTLDADNGDDATDTWQIRSEATGNDLSIVNDVTEVLNLTSTGNLQIDGGLTSAGITSTGVVNFGSATSLEIVSSTSPAVNGVGEIALDTDADGNYIDQGWLTYYDGTRQMYVPAFDTIGTPSDNDVIAYDATADKWVVEAPQGGGTPGGADTQLQYNDGGVFGGIANIIWDDTNLEFADAQHLAFGTDADWLLSYEQTGKEMLTVQTAKTSANNIDDGMMTVAVDTGNAGLTPNQEVFEVGKGASDDEEPNFTELMSVDADGDMTVLGTITAGSGPTQITTASGTLDGDQIEDDTVDEDSIDWGTGASQVSCADLPMTDCGAITSTGVVDFGGATSFELPNSDASPSAVGQLRLDTSVTGIINGAMEFHDGTNVRYLVDLDTLPSDDDYVVSYDADADKFYMKADSGGVGGSPGGADTQLQYNNSGAFGGISNIIWDDTNLEFADDQRLAFGTAADWLVSYEQSGEDTLSIQTANTASAHIDSGMLTLAVDTGNAGMTPDQEVFEIGRGATDDNSPNFTELFAVDEDGDVTVHGTITAGSGLIQITNPTGTIDGAQIANASIDDDAIDFTDVTSSDLTFDDDTVPTTAVYSGTVSLDDTASGASGASIIGVYDEFDNSNANNVQDVLDDLDAAIVGAGSGDVTGVGDCATGNCLDGSAGRGTYIRLYDGNSNYVEVTPANVTANRTITLPDSDQTVGTATTLSGNIVNDTNMVAEDFGDFTCDGNEDGCTLNADSVDSAEIATDAVGTEEIDLSISPAWTGAHDFGGATSLEIVNSTSPTVNGAGEIAIDTDADGTYITQGWLTYYDGTRQMYVPAFDAIGTPADNDVIAYNDTLHKWVVEAPQGGGGGIPGGADTQLQYNDGGSFGGIANIIWDDTNLEFADDQRLAFGTDADWLLSYEQTGKEMFILQTAKTSANNIDDGMMTVAVDTGNAGLTSNQEVFEVGKGASDDEDANFTELMSVDAEGDMTVLGTITAGSGPTQITTSAGTLDGDQIADDTIDEDSIDWGTGASQISCSDLPTTDCGALTSSGAIEGTSLTDGTASMASGAIAGVTSLTFTGADADPDAAGEIQYDNAVAGLTGGGLRWYDDNASSRLIVDLATDPSNDDYVVAYDATAQGFYMKVDAGASGGIPGGADTQLQYNDNGSFGGIANIIWDDTNLEFADAQRLAFGTDADWLLSYEQTGKEILTIQTAKTSANNIDDGMITVAVDTGNVGLTPNQQVFEVGRGGQDDEDANFTELFSVDSDGDVSLPGTITSDTVVANLFDADGAVDMDYGSADVTDHTFITDDSTFIIDGGITVSTGDNITLGATQWNSAGVDTIDGEVITDDTIDEDSVDWGTGASQVSCADLPTTDCGAITSSGAIEGTSLTDGTATISSGAISGATSLTLTGADADPTSSGEIRYDNAVAALSGGGLRWYDDDSSRLIVDLETDPSDDGYVVAYDATAQGFYMKSGTGVRFNAIDDANASTSIDFSSYPVTFIGAKTNEDFFNLDFLFRDNTSATDSLAVFKLDIASLSNDAGDVLDGIGINFENGATNSIIDSGIRINNSETTASTMVDGIVITSTGVDGGVVDGLDVSDSNITNAINIGSNPITEGTETFYYDSANSRWETSTDLHVNGALSKTTGSFDIVHPDPAKAKEGWRLRHSFVESPTRGDNLYRWEVDVKEGEAVIELPDYFKFLNENTQIWVSAKEHFGQAYGIINEEATRLVVKADTDGKYNVLAIATRKDKAAKEWFDKKGVEYK